MRIATLLCLILLATNAEAAPLKTISVNVRVSDCAGVPRLGAIRKIFPEVRRIFSRVGVRLVIKSFSMVPEQFGGATFDMDTRRSELSAWGDYLRGTGVSNNTEMGLVFTCPLKHDGKEWVAGFASDTCDLRYAWAVVNAKPQMSNGPARPYLVGVTAHEIGHLVGAGHWDDRDIMDSAHLHYIKPGVPQKFSDVSRAQIERCLR